VLYDFRRIKKPTSYFSKLESICYCFQVKKDFMNLIICGKAQITQVSKLENHRLGLGLFSMVR
jgi:hypothetical protein